MSCRDAGVQLPDGTVRAAFSLDTVLDGSLAVFIKIHNNATYVAGNITLLKVDLNVTSSTIGPVAIGPIQAIVNLFCAVRVLWCWTPHTRGS